MAAPITVTRKAGDKVTGASNGIQTPVDSQKLATAVAQLQNTVNALQASVDAIVTKFNAHTHSANDTAVIVGQQAAATSATPAAAGNKFTAS